MSTIQFEYDPERLIEEVKKRPGIWDFDDVSYRSKETRHKLWNEIVKELLQCNVNITKSERRELELQLQKKWKSIRDCFQKYVQHPDRTKRPYIYYKQLQFILKDEAPSEPHTQTLTLARHDGGDGISSESDEGKPISKRTWKSKKKLKLVKNEESSAEEEIDNSNYHEELLYTNDDLEDDIPAKVKRSNRSIDEFAFANVDLKSESEDADKLFLISLIPHLKAIPEEARLDVKMELMQVLRNAKYNAAHKLL